MAGAERGGDAGRIAGEGVKALILQPIGFLCDHVEILFDVDHAVSRICRRNAGVRLERPESLNASVTLAQGGCGSGAPGIEAAEGRKPTSMTELWAQSCMVSEPGLLTRVTCVKIAHMPHGAAFLLFRNRNLRSTIKCIVNR